MAVCGLRTLLLIVCILELIITIQRQVFDFLGYMWLPIIANFTNILFIIFGSFGAVQYITKYLLAERTKTVSNRNTVTLQWIKGHSGSLGNDAADELARRASSMSVCGPEPIVPIPFNQLSRWLQEHTHTQAESWWTSSPGCRQSKEAMPVLDGRLTRRLLRLDRRGLRLVTGTITGHCSLNKHFYTLGITDSPLCRACMEADETIAHVLFECTGVTQIRSETLGTPRSYTDVLNKPGDLISFWREVGWLE